MPTQPTLRTQVLVVGAGPVGAILALELAHHNVACVVVERAVAAPKHPGLDCLTSRSMELLRRLGLAELIREHGVHPDSASGFEWRQGLDQPPVLVWQCPSVNQLRGRYADVNDGSAPVELHQHVSGAKLAAHLREALRVHPLIDLREGWTFTDLRTEDGGTVAHLIDVRTGVRHTVAARHVAGCDGAQSTVRRCLEVPMEQLGPSAQHCSVFFRSEDPSLRAGTPALSTIIIGGLATVARSDGDTWVGHLPVAAGELVTMDPASMLRSRLGPALEIPEILGMTQWDDSLAVAAAYRRGPVYLVGDAAHRFHPVSDLADTSVGDAVDLGWKLAAVVNGWGGPGLLSSYELERRPCALIDRELLSRSLETRRRFSRLAAAGASREFLAGMLQQESHQSDRMSIQFTGRYDTSSVIWYDRGIPVPPPGPLRPATAATTAPGGRAPAVRLADGSQLFDHLGQELTLVDLTDDGAGAPLAAAANKRSIPVKHLSVTDAAVRAIWDHPLVLVRPDQHIAWRAGTAPDNWETVLDLVSGNKTT